MLKLSHFLLELPSWKAPSQDWTNPPKHLDNVDNPRKSNAKPRQFDNFNIARVWRPFEHAQVFPLFQYFWGESGHHWEMLNCPSADVRLVSPKKFDNADDYNNSWVWFLNVNGFPSFRLGFGCKLPPNLGMLKLLNFGLERPLSRLVPQKHFDDNFNKIFRVWGPFRKFWNHPVVSVTCLVDPDLDDSLHKVQKHLANLTKFSFQLPETLFVKNSTWLTQIIRDGRKGTLKRKKETYRERERNGEKGIRKRGLMEKRENKRRETLGKTPLVDLVCADCPGFLVPSAAGAPVSSFV